MRNRLMACAAVTLMIGALLDGCTKKDCLCDPGPLNCNEFQPGTDMMRTDFGGDPSIKGQIQAYAQATGDLSVVAGDALVNVTAACRNIAVDLGDDPDKESGVGEGEPGPTGADLLNFWCDEAKQYLAAAVAVGGGISNVTLNVTPAKCAASILDATKCQCDCASDGGVCASTLATCAGGTIESACTQGCSAGSAPYDCDGVCAGQCSGMCTPASDAGSCEGFCDGQCNGTCSPPPGQANAICSGNCLGSSQPISCTGGTLGGGCATDNDCQSNCNAAAQAAELCTPASVAVSSSSVEPNVAISMLIATVEKNLPAIVLVVQGQGQVMATTMKNVVHGTESLTSSKELDALSVVCLADMVAAAAIASANFADALNAASQVSAVIGGPTAN